MQRERRTEVLVVGGGLGGVAAALAALELGAQVVLTEEFDWLGGQLTTQGVPLDEGPWIESGVGSRSGSGAGGANRSICASVARCWFSSASSVARAWRTRDDGMPARRATCTP